MVAKSLSAEDNFSIDGISQARIDQLADQCGCSDTYRVAS